MGRKEGQRTKGNTKPSSSARSAELLSSTSLKSSTILTSTPNVDISSTIFGLTPLTAEEEKEIPDELKMALKKLSKKDSTTKLKALQEFCDLCSKEDDLKTSEAGMLLIMPYWPRLYSRLANDQDRRVREMAQKAHLVVVERVGRQLAPYLKSLAPSWHLSCSDPHLPASALASKALTSAFPDAIKKREAIIFCQQEILSSITENLLQHTPSTLSDAKSTSAEDMQEKYIRVLGTSLLSYGLFIEQLVLLEGNKKMKALEKAGNMHSNILKDPKFWKLAHHNNLTVRQSWYVFAGSLSKILQDLQSQGIIEAKQTEKFISYVMGKLDEPESAINSQMWDAALHLVHNFKSWHEKIDVKSIVLPKMIKFLKSESHLLSGIYPRILPLVAAIPQEDLEDFYAEILASIKSGLKTFVISTRGIPKGLPGAGTSSLQSGGSACVMAYFEVALHCLKNSRIHSPIFDQIFEWIQNLLEEGSSEKESRLVFMHVAKLLKSLQKASEDLYLDAWDRIKALFTAQHLEYRHFLFCYILASLGTSEIQHGTKPNAIRFEERVDEKSGQGKMMKPILSGFYCEKHLLSLLESCIVKALDVDKVQEESYIFSQEILDHFPSLKLPNSSALLEKLIDINVLKKVKVPREVHVQLCIALLTHPMMKEGQERDLEKTFYDVVTTYEDQDWVLAFISGLLQGAESHSSHDDARIKAFISSPTFLQKLQNTLANGESREKRSLLKTALQFANLIPSGKLNEILSYLVESLKTNQFESRDSDGKWIQNLVPVLCKQKSVWCLEASEDFLQALLQTSLKFSNIEGLKDDWLLCLESYQKFQGTPATFDYIKNKSALEIKKHLQNHSGDNLKFLAQLTAEMLRLIRNQENWPEILDLISLEDEHDQMEVLSHSKFRQTLVTSVVSPRLFCYQEHAEFPGILSRKAVEFYSNVVCSIVDMYEDNVANVPTLSRIITSLMAHLIEKSSQVLAIDQPQVLLDHDLLKLLPQLSEEMRKKLEQEVLQASLKYGHFSAHALKYVKISSFDDISRQVYLPGLEKISLPVLHTMQALISSQEGPRLNESSSAVTKYLDPLLAAIKAANEPEEEVLFKLSLAITICQKLDKGIAYDISQLLETLSHWQKEKNVPFLFESDVTEVPWESILRASIFAETLAVAAKYISENDNDDVVNFTNTDFLLCSTVSWIQTLDESRSCIFQPGILRFAQAVSNLAYEVANMAKCETMLEEWNEFFAASIFPAPLEIFVHIATSSNEDLTPKESLLCFLGRLLKLIPQDLLINHQLPAKFLAADVDAVEGSLPNNLVALLNHLGPLLLSESRSVQIISFTLLKRIMPEVLKAEEQKSQENTNSSRIEDEDTRAIPRRLAEIITQTEAVLEVIASSADFTTFGEPLPAPLPFPSPIYSATTAYFLTWELILTLISQASAELRPKYSAFLRKSNYLKTLMDTLFHIMPMKTPEKENSTTFGQLPSLEIRVANEDTLMDGSEMHQLACCLYHSLLKNLPALVRNWWNLSEKKVSNIVEKFTCTYVTPTLWAAEVKSVQDSKATFDNMVIKVRPSVREVVAVYTIDEGSMELVVQLPINFPLGPVNVDSGKKVGVTAAQWRTWMLQLTTFLQHQNGSLVDALTLWKKNVDKRFEGVEECYICFFILHGSTYQMPKVACPTCKKKFHSACLYKWFSTSQNSTCPLCRNLF